MSNLPLFEEPSHDLKTKLRRRLSDLAAQSLYVGTSSWKYEGWLGQIYSPGRYLACGRFSRKRFEAECLAEYAEVFPIVCGGFSFYQFPSAGFWRKLFGSTAPGLRFALKIPEEITTRVFPRHTVVARALLKPGRPYEAAVPSFSSYRSVQEPNHEAREALRNLLIRALQRSQLAYLFINNRLDGNAPETIEAIVDAL